MEEEDLPRCKLQLAGLRLHGLVSSSLSSCCVKFLVFRVGRSSLKIALESLLPGNGPSSTGRNRVRLVLLDPPSSCPSPWPSPGSTVLTADKVKSMRGIMILGVTVCEHQTRGDKPGRAPSVPPCLALASGDFGLRCCSAGSPASDHQPGAPCEIGSGWQGLMPGRLGGGVHVAALRCCAALALTQPPPTKGLYASARYPAETATLTKIRVFFAGYRTYDLRIYDRRILPVAIS